jgi:hypothetical protein
MECLPSAIERNADRYRHRNRMRPNESIGFRCDNCFYGSGRSVSQPKTLQKVNCQSQTASDGQRVAPAIARLGAIGRSYSK